MPLSTQPPQDSGDGERHKLPKPLDPRTKPSEMVAQLSVVESRFEGARAKTVAASAAFEIIRDRGDCDWADALRRLLKASASEGDRGLRAFLIRGVAKNSAAYPEVDEAVLSHVLKGAADPAAAAAALDGIADSMAYGGGRIPKPEAFDAAVSYVVPEGGELVGASLRLINWGIIGLEGGTTPLMDSDRLFLDGRFMDALVGLATGEGRERDAADAVFDNIGVRTGMMEPDASGAGEEFLESLLRIQRGSRMLTGREIDALVRAARPLTPPGDALSGFYERGARVVFLSADYGRFGDNVGELSADIIRLARESGVSHVAVPVANAYEPLLEQVERTGKGWGDWDQDFLGGAEGMEGNDRSVLNLLLSLRPHVKLVFYGPPVSSETHGDISAAGRAEPLFAALGEIDMEKGRGMGRMLVLGSFLEMPKTDVTDRDGVPVVSVARYVAGELGEGKTAHVVEFDRAGVQNAGMARLHNLYKFVDRLGPEGSFAMPVEGTPISALRAAEDYVTTFGEAWDGVDFRIPKDGGGGRQPRTPRVLAGVGPGGGVLV
jgi:hypothetical protein